MQFKYEQEAVNLDEPEADYEEDFEQVDQEAQEPPNEYPDVQGKVVLVGNEHVPEQAPDTVDTRVKCNICDRKYNPDSYVNDYLKSRNVICQVVKN